ncbi:Sodium/hydrogen exchanger family-domain-containing protein [Hysterangium stoloniferum]|nr:Sodium/hydrogen exchanger family-domain-containing protein [Hysterangium stoloniferum]
MPLYTSAQQKILHQNGEHIWNDLDQIYDPLRMWIFQFGIIIIVTQIISLPLRRLHQPKVIAEVLGGIILSPSILGRIPGFTETVFPDESIPYLTLLANIGIILFLFLVGLEIDGEIIRKNARLSMSIAVAGMIIPFSVGSVFSIAIYNQFIDPTTNFTHFLLFVGVAFSITAFPVLCRILTELKLLDTTIGIVVLSAGVANDIVGWTLLAVTTALANSGSSLAALQILLPCIGWSLFLLFPVRRAFYWLAHTTGSIRNGPTLFFTTCTLITVFCSALLTDMIGVHAIFGGFLAGLVIPRNNGLAVALTEKLEDMVSILFLPLYFTLSGLSTDFGLLNDEITWAFTLGIILIAWSGKFGGCAAAARLSGFHWREATSIGTLMSCKGLVELIVLNVGLSAGILNTRVFSMFVLEALFLTFMTTPVVVKIYPPAYHNRNAFSNASPKADISDGLPKDSEINSLVHSALERKSRLVVVLDKAEHLPSILSITQLFCQLSVSISSTQCHVGGDASDLEWGSPSPTTVMPSITVNALRLVELSDRVSDVMKSTMENESLIQADPVLNIFKASCRINRISTAASLSVVPFEDLAARVSEYATETLSQLVIIPWLHYSSVAASFMLESGKSQLDGFGLRQSLDSSPPKLYCQFLCNVMSLSKTDIALFIDRERGETWQYDGYHLLLPFLGGSDDRFAFLLIAQLCFNPNTTATIFRLDKCRDDSGRNSVGSSASETAINSQCQENGTHDSGGGSNNMNAVSSMNRYISKKYGQKLIINLQVSGLTGERQDTLLWDTFTTDAGISTLSPALRDAVTRMNFIEKEPSTTLRGTLAQLQTQVVVATQQKKQPFMLVGRRRGISREQNMELRHMLGTNENTPELRQTIGDLGTLLTRLDNTAGLIVVQRPSPLQ